MRQSRLVTAFVVLLLVPACAPMAGAQTATAAPTQQPVGFAGDIRAFLERDRIDPPPREAILFIGSSIFLQWTNLGAHMTPLPVFNRAFGGSRTWEVLHYMDQIVLPYRPRVIVYYAGSNDVNAGESAAAIVSRTKAFIDRVHTTLPETRVLYVAITRSPDKRTRWDVVDAVNTEMRAAAAKTTYLQYVDLNPVLFDARGEPKHELYRPDGLHFYAPAYDLFTAIVKPVLTDVWRDVGTRASTGGH